MASELSRLNATRSGGYRLGSGDDDEAAAVRAVAVFETEQQAALHPPRALTRRARGPAPAFPGPAGALYEALNSTQRAQFWLVLVAGGLFLLWQTVASVNPLQVGLLRNDWTSFVQTDAAFGPGLHWVGVGKSFVLFPATQVNLVFSDTPAKGIQADSGPVLTRTGDGGGDEDSGGQPITICLSLQYTLPRDHNLGDIYASFGAAYHARFLLITRNTVSNAAQQFGPVDFWQRRTAVADAMLAAVKESLAAQCGAVQVTQLQLLRIDFPDQYESMITKIQLQVQAKATAEYTQQVVGILNDLSVLTAENAAKVGVVAARAERTSAELRNAARAQGLVLLQAARGNATSLVQGALGLTSGDLVQYLKLAAVKAHGAQPGQATVLGLGDPFPA